MYDKEKIIKLRSIGKSYSEISQELGCSRQYAHQVCNQQSSLSDFELTKINNLIVKGFSIEEIRKRLKFVNQEIFNKKVLYKEVKYPVLRNYIIFNYNSYNSFCEKIGCSNAKFCKFIKGNSKHNNDLIEMIEKETGLNRNVFLR